MTIAETSQVRVDSHLPLQPMVIKMVIVMKTVQATLGMRSLQMKVELKIQRFSRCQAIVVSTRTKATFYLEMVNLQINTALVILRRLQRTRITTPNLEAIKPVAYLFLIIMLCSRIHLSKPTAVRDRKIHTISPSLMRRTNRMKKTRTLMILKMMALMDQTTTTPSVVTTQH